MSIQRYFLLVIIVVSLIGPKISSGLSCIMFSTMAKDLIEFTCEKSDEEIKGESDNSDNSFREKSFSTLAYNNNYNNLWKLLLPMQRNNKACFYYYPEIFTPPPEIS